MDTSTLHPSYQSIKTEYGHQQSNPSHLFPPHRIAASMDTLERELREETGKNNLPGVMLAAANIDGMLSVRPFKAETPHPSTSPDKGLARKIS